MWPVLWQGRALHCSAGISQVAVEINKAGLVKGRLVVRGEGKRGEESISSSKNEKNVMQFLEKKGRKRESRAGTAAKVMQARACSWLRLKTNDFHQLLFNYCQL